MCPIFDFFFVLAIEPGGAVGFESESELEPEDDDDEEDEEDERFEESLSVSSFFAATEGRILLQQQKEGFCQLHVPPKHLLWTKA